MKKDRENPNPELFTTFEQLEIIHRVEVTEENIHLLARYFGCTVDYSVKPFFMVPTNHRVEVGSWVDDRGSRWNPEPLTQGYHPAGTYRMVTS